MLWRIYKYTNIVTGQSYIGQTTKNVNERARNGHGYRKDTPFREAIDKYGWENFEQSILRLCVSQEEADHYEQLFIDKYNTLYPNGYNLESGGVSNKHLHSRTKQKASESHKGIVFTEEHKQNISNSKKGKTLSEECKQSISKSLKGKTRPPFTKEWRQNISKASKGIHWYNDGVKNVKAYSCPDGFVSGMLIKS